MSETLEGPIFRASKRRKIIRNRKRADDDEDGDEVVATPDGPTPARADDEDVAEADDRSRGRSRGSTALRHRRTVGARKGGVGFSSSDSRRHTTNTQDMANAPAPQSAVENAQARFVAPTGHIASADDKHMMAYVDTKFARLHSSTPTNHLSPPDTDTRTQPQSPVEFTSNATKTPHSHSAAGGDLQEVDLGPSVARDIAAPRSRPVRLDRNGKPMRPRKNPNRRNSADMARDAMVDQILRESRLDMYDSSHNNAAPANNRAGQNEDADDRMAEEFKRNFYAAAEEKNVRKPPPPPPGAKNDLIKGPKLGGSRSQRAAMHAIEKAKTKK